LFGFERTSRGDYEPDLIKPGKFHHMVGDHHMTDMYGVKGAEV
jgi:hypothetical protein